MGNIAYIKHGENVVGFSRDGEAFPIAKYVLTFPENVHKRFDEGYTIFNHRTAILTDVIKTGECEYRIGWYPSQDAASLYKLCKIVKG